MSSIINRIRHKENSLVCSTDDDVGPNNFLLDLSLKSINLSIDDQIDIPSHALRFRDMPWANIFPGEHYRLLKSIVKVLNPSVVVEIGTSSGLGTLAIKQGLTDGVVHTFDVFPWTNFDSYLTNSDFESKIVTQHIGDLSYNHIFEKYRSLLNQANLIFIDAPKDGIFEYKLMSLIASLDNLSEKILFIDDIKLMNMIEFWRRIQSPKLDITSFGHWSGTGLVDISKKLNWIS